MEKKEEEKITNNNNNENTNMEPAAPLSDVGKTVFGKDDIEKTHEQEVSDCPEGTLEEKHELTITLKDVEKMAEKSRAENYPKNNKNDSTFSKSQKAKVKHPKIQEPQKQQEHIQDDERIR